MFQNVIDIMQLARELHIIAGIFSDEDVMGLFSRIPDVHWHSLISPSLGPINLISDHNNFHDGHHIQLQISKQCLLLIAYLNNFERRIRTAIAERDVKNDNFSC